MKCLTNRFFVYRHNLKHLGQRLRRQYSSGLLGFDALTSPAGFEILEQTVYRECAKFIEETKDSQRSRKMVEIFDDLSNSICKVADLAECMRNLHPDPKFAYAAEECMSRLSSFVEQLNTNTELYGRLKRCVEMEGDETDRRVASLFASDFEASGVHLPESQRQKFVALSEEIFRAGSNFSRGCELPIKVVQRKSKLSINSVLDKFQNNEDERTIYISGNDADSPDPENRSLGYKLFYRPSDEQELYLKSLVQSRHRLAETSGFYSYAQRSLRDCILEKPEQVDKFLVDLIRLIKPKAEAEMDLLQRLMPKNRPLAIWDLPYLKSVFRAEHLSNVSSKLCGRFDIQSVFDGIVALVKDLYNLTLKKVPTGDGETWHDDVEKVLALDENGNVCGTIYCDWFDRQSKNASDSHFTVRCGKKLGNSDYQTPVVVLTFRYSKKRNSDQKAFTLIEFTNILHEFGHALHSILGRTRYQHVSGTRCPTDFAEVPSNLMEFYLLNNSTLMKFAKTDCALDPQEIASVTEAMNLFSSIETLQQAIFSLFDLRLHSNPGLLNNGASTTAIFDCICDEVWPFMKVDGTAWHHRFSHLVPYGSKYHAYLVARATASIVWQHLFKLDPLAKSAGEQWRRVQSFGGEIPPKDLLGILLNKPLSSTDLSKALL